MKITLFLAVSLSAAVCAGGVAAARAQKSNAAPRPDAAKGGRTKAPPAAGGPAAEKFGVLGIDEADLKRLLERSAELKRPLLVNFWATWCEPCRKEFPDLVKIREQNNTGLLDFITVSLDDTAERETGVPRFLGEMRATRIPAYLLNASDPDAAINLVDPQWRGELPATFLFDREGRLAYKHMGRVDPVELQAEIEKALGANQKGT